VRPVELAQDDSPEWLAWQHAIQTYEAAVGNPGIDVFVCIPPTAPLRIVQDVEACIQALLGSNADLVLTVKPAERNPYFNMVVLDEDNNARLVVQPEQRIHRRQVAPSVFDITTVAYAARPEFVLNANSIFEGRVKAVIVPPERALDIDTPLDFKIAELLMGHPREITSLFVSPQTLLRDVLICLDATKRGIALVVDGNHHLLDVITDGDVRRALLAGFDLMVPVQKLTDYKGDSKPITAPAGTPRDKLIGLMRETRVSHIPILDRGNRVVGLIELADLLLEDSLPAASQRKELV
jgi:CMP-N-acetylneuraminic acid synthetase